MGVSGGVDSMALAILCRNYVRTRRLRDCVAFVVDHGARKGSAKEAERVARYLDSKGDLKDLLTIR